MNLLLAGICCLITCIGGVYAGTVRDPYAKLIGIGVIGGGVIPHEDIPGLRACGVREVFTPGTPVAQIIAAFRDAVAEHRRNRS